MLRFAFGSDRLAHTFLHQDESSLVRMSNRTLRQKRKPIVIPSVLLLILFLLPPRTAAIGRGDDDSNKLGAEDVEERDAYETFFDKVIIPSMDQFALDSLDGGDSVEVSASTAASLGGSCAADALTVRILEADRKILILGGGPAGLSAAIYAARADMAPLILARDGGQLESTSIIDNYPGFEDGTDAVQMLQKLEKQAARFGADTKYCDVTRVDLSCRPFKVYCSDNGERKKEVITSSALVIATGAEAKWLGVKGEQKYLSKGVHTCATCDGFFYKDKDVTVIGGGDTAMEQALFLARLCRKVTLIHRGSSFRASRAMASRAIAHPNITIQWNTVVKSFEGRNDSLTHLVLQPAPQNVVEIDALNDGNLDDANKRGKGTTILKTSGVFVAIGQVPNTQLFQEQVRHNEHGYLYTGEY